MPDMETKTNRRALIRNSNNKDYPYRVTVEETLDNSATWYFCSNLEVETIDNAERYAMNCGCKQENIILLVER